MFAIIVCANPCCAHIIHVTKSCAEGFSKLVCFHILSAEGSFLFESDEMHNKGA